MNEMTQEQHQQSEPNSLTNTDEFMGRVAVVTGAGSGIGFALCRRLAEHGASVALNDIDGPLARKAAETINTTLDKQLVTPYALDIADLPAVRAMFQDVMTRNDRLDIVIANAGITNFGAFIDYPIEAFDRVTSVNLRGNYFTAQIAAQYMKANGSADARILFTSSVTGIRAYPNLSAYGMTKAALIHLSRVLAVELGKYGITVNVIAPGATLTERTLIDDPDYEANWSAVAPNGQVGRVADVVAAAMFLASRGARHITGQCLVVDGGWTLSSPIPAETPDLPDYSSTLH